MYMGLNVFFDVMFIFLLNFSFINIILPIWANVIILLSVLITIAP